MNSGVSQDFWKARDPSPKPIQPPAIPGLTVIKLLGTGGFGAVWLCEQSEPLKRLVAVKVIRNMIAGPRLRDRFESERRMLARMDHPGIAQVFDAGETHDGSLYFIMELVEGEPLAQWCDRHRLSIELRLGLMRQVAAAVQHAHSKGIIHLDLKSSNILVREVDGLPFIKVIDFGIARLADDEDAIVTQSMDSRESIGTLEFMAPEQLSGARQLDTRADIYALGVTLQQLLTGLLPFDARMLKAVGTVESQRLIRESVPDSPSDVVRRANQSEPAEAKVRAEARGATPRSLQRLLCGQLDSIVLHCLEKIPDQRYPTCDALSQDITRWLCFEPILAKPASRVVRLRKFARRNRLALSSVAFVAVGMVVALVVMGYGLSEARRQLARAERLHGFNTQMIESVDPDVAKGMDTRLLRLIFDQSMGSIDVQYCDDPILAADAHQTAGMAYKSIGDFEKAIEHFRRHYEQLSELYPADDARVLQAKNDLGHSLLTAGNTTESAPLLESVFERRQALLGDMDPATLASMHNIAWLRDKQSELKESRSLYLDVSQRKRALLGLDHESTLQSMHNLGEIQRRLGEFADARATLEEVVARRIARNGKDQSDTLLSRNNYCMVLRSMDQLESVEPAFRELIADMDRILGPDHPYTLVTQNNLASILRETNRLQEAETIYRAIIARFTTRYGADGVYTLSAAGNLALALEKQRRFEEAELIYLDTLARKRASQGDKAQTTLSSILNLGSMYVQLGRFDEALKLLREVRAGATEKLGPNHPISVSSAISLARTMLRAGDSTGAAALARETIGVDESKLPRALLMSGMRTIGESDASKGEFKAAIVALTSAYEIAISLKQTEEAKEIARVLARVATDAGDSDAARRWQELSANGG